MNLAQARQQYPHLNDYSDEELLNIVAQSNNIRPGTPMYEQLKKQLLSHYERSWGEAAADTARGLVQGVAGVGEMVSTLGSMVVPGVNPYDNPVTNTFGRFREWVGEYNSPGLRAMQEESQRRAAIAEQQAREGGAGFWGETAAGVGAQARSYWDMPATAFQDFVSNAPQLVAGGVAGRGLQISARALGAGARTSVRAGVAGGVGVSGAMQGADVGNETYERAIAAGATPEQATELANQAALRAGGASVGLSLLPGGTAIERSLVRGAGPGRLGLGAVGRGVGEAVSEGLEEGYGQFASNQAVQVVDPSVSLAGGVGGAAVQGAAVGGPLGAVMRPRTATGEIDLTKDPVPPEGETVRRISRAGNVEVEWDEPVESTPAQAQPAADLDRPAYQRRGLDPLNERSSPWPEGAPPTMVDLVGPPVQQTPRTMADLYSQPLPADPFTEWEQQAAVPQPAQPPLQLPYSPTIYTDPTGVAQVGQMPTEQEVAQRRYAPQPADPTPEQQTREQLRSMLTEVAAELRPTYLKKDGTLNKTAEAAFAKILAAKDPAEAIEAIRSSYQNGAGPRDQILDELRNRIISLQTNSAGFVSEPTEQLQAQADATREGRKPAMVMGVEDAARVDLQGLQQTQVTDPRTGETAVVASADPQLVGNAQARVDQVGLRQAMGELQGVANPTLTSQPAPNSMTIQQVDDATGQVIQEEVATEADIPNVRQVPGTTARVVPNEQVIEERVAAQAPQAAPQQAKAKKPKAPRLGRKTVDELIEIADTTKSQEELDAAELEIYKRWMNHGDEQAEQYFEGQTKRTRELQKMLEAEREAQGAKKGQELGRKFGASYRPASEVTGKPLSRQQLERELERIKRTVPAARTVQIAESPEALGLDVPEGFVADAVTMPDGQVYLFPGALASPLEVERALFHELFHRGLKVSMTPEQYARTMMAIAARDPRVHQYANQWKASEIGQHTREAMSGGRPLTGNRLASYEATAVDEALARIAEELVADKLPGSKRGTVRNLAAWLANVANTLGFKNLAQWLRRQTYNDTEKFVIDTLQRVSDTTQPIGPDGGTRFRGRSNPITQPFQQAAKANVDKYKGHTLSENLLKLLSVRQIEEQYGKYLPAFRDWMNAVFERGSKASRIAARADRVARQWERSVKDKAQREALADVLLRATVAELELDNTSKDYLDSLTADQRKEHALLRAKLAGLSPEAQQARKDALQILRDQWEYTREALESFITHTISDPDLRAERIDALRTEFGRRRGDYFPLSRFGDTVVIARKAASDGRDVIQFFESERQANEEVARLRREGITDVVITKRTDHNAKERPSTGFIGELHALIDRAEMDGDTKNALHESVQQLFLKSLPEMSGAKHLIRRENVEGFSKDALRAFADAVTRGARYASHLEFAPAIQAAMESAAEQSRSSDKRTAAVVIGTKEGSPPAVRIVPTGTDRLKAFDELQAEGYTVRFFNTPPEAARERLAAALESATDAELDNYVKRVEQVVGRTEDGIEDLRAAKTLYNFMVNRQRAEIQPETLLTKAVDAAGQVGYAWFLGFTPMFWMMNILQNPMVGIPHLGAKYGVSKAATEWGKAMAWFGQVRMGKLLNDSKTPFSIEWLRNAVKEQKITGISEAELKMLQRLEDRQVLDFTQAMDLARIGENSSNKWTKAMRLAAAGAHHTEVFNRVTFALAAYRLALRSDPSITHEQAVQRAENDVAAAHFDYSGANKPELMQGKARLIFMFQQYRQHMLYWWAKQLKDATKGETPEDRRQARKAALLMATTQGMFAGAMGLPFVGAIHLAANLLAAAFGDDDEPYDFEQWLTEAAKEQFGEQGAAIFTKGVFAAMGMSISQRIGQADLLPFANVGSARFERSPEDKTRAYLFDMFGPLGSIALGVARSMDDFERGDVLAGLADASPKFAADIAKALQMNNEGIKNSRGELLATQEAFDGWDVALQALGATPLRAAQIRDKRGKVMEVERHYLDRGTALRTAFIQAWSRGDREGMAEALTDIQKFNRHLVQKYRNVPQIVQSFGITRQKLETAAKDYRQRALIRALTQGSAETKRQALLALQMSGMLSQPQADDAWSKGWD